jgi:hypothetical protein
VYRSGALDRQNDRKGGASMYSVRARAHADVAAVLVNDLLADPKAEPGAHHTFGGEKRLKQAAVVR